MRVRSVRNMIRRRWEDTVEGKFSKVLSRYFFSSAIVPRALTNTLRSDKIIKKGGDVVTVETTRREVRRRPRNKRAGIAAMLTVYSVGHFFIDMCCCAAMFTFARGTEYFTLSLLIYGAAAFVLRVPIGALADRFGKTGGMAVFGCVAIAVAMLTTPAPVVLAAVLGIGNACFHVGGGIFALRSLKKCAGPGVLISTGTVGYFAGQYIADAGAVSETVLMISVAAAMILCVLAVCIIEPVSETYESVAPFPKGLSVSYPLRNFSAFVCFFLAVLIRSFGGGSFNFGWRGSIDPVFAGLILAVSTALGIIFGGVVTDKLGIKAALSVTMILSAILMLLSESFIVSAAAIVAFNMSAPMMLRAPADVYRGHEGLSLGLMSSAYFAGYLLSEYGASLPFGIYGNVTVVLVSMAVTAAGLELTSRRMKPV